MEHGQRFAGLFQPIAADDVAAIVADGARVAAKRHRRNRRPGTSTVQRNRRPLSEGGRRPACGRERPRGPRYFGGRVEERSLVPLGEARLGRIAFDEWLRRSRAAA